MNPNAFEGAEWKAALIVALAAALAIVLAGGGCCSIGPAEGPPGYDLDTTPGHDGGHYVGMVL